MDNKACSKGQPVARKVKKKQVKDELDRIKQAEKKKRRLEKALATSAAIRSELEKKKQKKKEEQQRLDEEGAAIAEAVALHVLLGEDTDDSCNIVLNRDTRLSSLDLTGNIDLLRDHKRAGHFYQHGARSAFGRIGWVSDAYGSGCKWDGFDNGDWSFTYGPYRRDLYGPYFQEQGWNPTGFSAELIAAEAVSSLRIAEDAHAEAFVLDGILRG